MTTHQEHLKQTLSQLNEAKKHLETSYKNCKKLPHADTEGSLIQFEALTSRFARTVDILIHKVYRSLDAVELVQGGTIIDVINRADKRELVDSPQMIRAMKELRNDIAHEYVSDRLQLLHEQVFNFVPTLLSYIDRANHYAKQYIN